jgi:hypothetical protein
MPTSAFSPLNSFEDVIRELNFLPEEYANSTKLRAWVLRYKDEKYVPSDLLKAFGFECADR